MKFRFAAVLLFLIAFTQVLRADDDTAVSFNVSTSKSFAPGEEPKIHLYTHNVDALEFRVYRVNDPAKFLENLRELHSFGHEDFMGKEQIDERSRLERFHDWKLSVWRSIRYFFRRQFSSDAREQLRDKQTVLKRKSRIVSAAEFAQVPLLNSSQVVARWRQQVPSTFLSDTNELAVPKLEGGLYLLEATDGRYKAYTILMVSQMALVTRSTSGSVTAFVADRVTGAPIAGVKVDAGFGQTAMTSAVTDAHGIADLPITGEHSSQDNFWVLATNGKEVAVTTPGTWALTYSSGGKLAGYIFTERPVYRPTHTVHWKAIVRDHKGNALQVPAAGTQVHVTITDGADKTLFERDMPLSATGDVTGEYELPKNAALGYYSLRIGDSDTGLIATGFHVEEYRKPEYRVAVAAKSKRVLQGQTMPVTIDSRYFFGEPVANGKVKYRIYHERRYWWGEEDSDSSSSEDADSTGDSYNGDEEAEKTGTLDANGVLTVQVPTAVDDKSHSDTDYTVEAGVTDAANREITGRGRFLSTYGTFRVRVEPVNYAVRANEVAKFRVTTVDYDDKPVSTRVHLALQFHHYSNGTTETVKGNSTDATTDASGHALVDLPVGSPKDSSAEVIATASAVQGSTRDPIASSYLWIMGVGEQSWDSSSDSAQIVSDKKSYQPGETAHISIVSEVENFHALVLVQGNALLKREVMHTDGKTLSFDLPITQDAQPNISVSAIFLRNNTLYQATRALKVPPLQQQLQVSIAPSKDVFQPQQSAAYDVTTKDFTGKPVAADLSFGVVDEAIYSLYPDESGDMVRHLYPSRYVEAQVDSSLDYYFSGEAGTKSPMLALRKARFRPQLAQVKPGNEEKPRVRKAFPDTAFWSAHVRTDDTGHAKVNVVFPDSLTTWRATVHAITPDSKAGSIISRVLVRKNVLVRMGTPRFLIKGDDVTLPVIVHNYLPDAKQAAVSLKVEGLDVTNGSQQTVTIPSRSEATVLWRLHAANVGTAKLTATAITNEESDALELSFPVEPAGVAKDIAGSGVTTATAAFPFNYPAGTDAAAHSLQVEVSPSIAGALLPALKYLTSFPYGCTEQTMSSFLPNVIVADTLKRLNVGAAVDPADLQRKLQAGLDRLKDYQHDDGGWGWWKEDDSRVFMTAYVVGGIGQGANALQLNADQRNMLDKGVAFLKKNLEEHPRMRPELRAAVLYGLANAGTTDLTAGLDAEWSRRKDLQPEALAMVGLAMLQVHDARATQAADLLLQKARKQGDLTSWEGSYVPFLDADYTNDAEATAYAVRLIARVHPDSTVLPGAAQWLMAARNGGEWWNSTEQTAMVLFGLVDYLAASHELDADMTVQVLLNGQSIGTRHFTAADTQTGSTLSIDIDSARLQPSNNSLQVVRSDGKGRVYWSARAHYFSTAKKDAQSGTMSLNLTRDYYKLQPLQKNGKIVYTLQPLQGNAQIGDVLAVHEAINGTAAKYLLLEDPIPAGTEFVQNESSYAIENKPGGWFDWFTRREFHDDHAAFFATEFDGRKEIFYLIRVVTPGTFQASPARVQPMYQPDVQATSDGMTLQVPAPQPAPQTGGPQ